MLSCLDRQKVSIAHITSMWYYSGTIVINFVFLCHSYFYDSIVLHAQGIHVILCTGVLGWMKKGEGQLVILCCWLDLVLLIQYFDTVGWVT